MTTTTATHPLADRWVAMARDGGRPPHLGVLTRVRPWTAPDGRTWWSWVLRTHTGHLVGSSTLADTGLVPRVVAAGLADIAHDRGLLSDLPDLEERP
ncbi:hypothetical protein [Nocardiopsis sp. CC223A]|uniref:hypothetical protein n=1 Tax=Nocardiopsis sp. CC223A TaxID=3044051 RepID=UPI00278C0DDC|nr:hypothetical protein [Nocardiopsis sp. CC223A]